MRDYRIASYIISVRCGHHWRSSRHCVTTSSLPVSPVTRRSVAHVLWLFFPSRALCLLASDMLLHVLANAVWLQLEFSFLFSFANFFLTQESKMLSVLVLVVM